MISPSAQKILDICERGAYTAPSGQLRPIGAALAAAREGTCLFRPAELGGLRVPRGGPARVEVTGETTIAAARRLVQVEGAPGVMALNFASARNVGGGFLGGARAQEEDLCRASGLYLCLTEQPDYYEANRRQPSALYTDHAIWSPGVPVFAEDGALLEEPFLCSFLTSPAPNAGAALDRGESRGAIRRALFARARQVIAIAADRGHRTLVLGAWGCGVFRNDPSQVAGWFREWLADGGPYASAFETVVFAVLDSSPERRFLGPFEERFGAD